MLEGLPDSLVEGELKSPCQFLVDAGEEAVRHSALDFMPFFAILSRQL